MSGKHKSPKIKSKEQPQPESDRDVADDQASEPESPANKASRQAAEAAYKKTAKRASTSSEEVTETGEEDASSSAPPLELDELLKKLDEAQALSAIIFRMEGINAMLEEARSTAELFGDFEVTDPSNDVRSHYAKRLRANFKDAEHNLGILADMCGFYIEGQPERVLTTRWSRS